MDSLSFFRAHLCVYCRSKMKFSVKTNTKLGRSKRTTFWAWLLWSLHLYVQFIASCSLVNVLTSVRLQPTLVHSLVKSEYAIREEKQGIPVHDRL